MTLEQKRQFESLLTEAPIESTVIMQYALLGVVHISNYEDGKRYLGLVNAYNPKVYMWDARTQRFHGQHIPETRREVRGCDNPLVCCSPYNDDGSDIFIPLMKLPEDRQFRGRNAYRQKQYSVVRF